MDDEDRYEWELSKENIQPIRQGRAVDALLKGLDGNHVAMLNKKRR